MLGDNKAYHDIVQQEGASARTRYYERAVLLVKRAVMLLLTTTYLIGTDSMTADIFTKALDKATFFSSRNWELIILCVAQRQCFCKPVAVEGS